jgi:hypothetical protein
MSPNTCKLCLRSEQDAWGVQNQAARAEAGGNAIAIDDSEAAVKNVAVADGPGASATALGGCMAIDNSSCSAPNTAIAVDGPSTASATGASYAEGNSTADQTSEAVASAGGLSIADTYAEATRGSEAEAVSEAKSNGAGSAAAGGADAIARNGGVATATNFVTADEGGTAIGASESIATGSTLAGAGVSTTIACTAGQVSCGGAFALAIGGGGEALALTDTSVAATNGETVNLSASAILPAQAGIGCTAGAFAGLEQDATGNWVFTHGANAGFACADTNGGFEANP